MSIIALRWAYSSPIKNPIEKNILAFLASHNFGGDKSCFKVRNISAATAYSERAVRDALKNLAGNGYLKKVARYGDKGQQLSNEYQLNIPEDFADDCYKAYGEPIKEVLEVVDNSDQKLNKTGGGVHHVQGGGAPRAGGGVRHVHPLNNKLLNNNINKKLLYEKDQKKHKPVDNPKEKMPHPAKTAKEPSGLLKEYMSQRKLE